MNIHFASIISRPAIACSLAALAPAASVLPINPATTALLLAGYTAFGLLAIVLRDYARPAIHRRSRTWFRAPRWAHAAASPTGA